MKDTSLNQRQPAERPRSVHSATIAESKSLRSKVEVMGRICRSRSKVVCLVEEEIDLGKEGGFGDSECMWLSSASSSPSSFLEDYELDTSLQISVDKWLVSWLSTLANSYVYLDEAIGVSNETGVSSDHEEACLALESIDGERVLQKDLVEKKLSLTPQSAGNDALFSSGTSIISAVSSHGQQCQEFMNCDKLPMTSITVLDSCSSSSQTLDLKRMSYVMSLLNLDSEELGLISDTDLDYFQSDFPSSSSNCKLGSEVLSSASSVSSHSKLKDERSPVDFSSECASSEAADLEDLDTDDGPLFWPYECKVDWSSENAWKCFSMSPRKEAVKFGTPPRRASSKPVGSKACGTQVGFKAGVRRSLTLSAGSPVPRLLGQKEASNNSTKKCVNMIKSAPPRLRKSTKSSTKVVPIKMEDDMREAKDTGVSVLKSDCEDAEFLDDDIASNVELPIETLLGLSEFDGHEGVDSGFNEDGFSLDYSL